MNRRLVLKAGAALLAGVAAPALAQSAPDKLTVLLDWFVNPDHATLVIAAQKGYFRDAGLDVTLVPPADPSAPPRLVAARQADIAVSYQPQLHLQVGQGLPLLRIGTCIGTPLKCVAVLADGPVKTLADLKGRTVGFSVSGTEQAVLGTMLRTNGVNPADVRLVNVNFALSQSLIAGRVDAVIGAFRNFEMTQLRLEGREGRAFFPEEHGVPAYDELIYVAHRDRMRDPRLRRFIDAIERATVYLLNHPQDSWALFKAAYPALDDALNRQAWIDTLPRFDKRPGAMDRARYERFAAFLVANDLLRDPPPVDTYAVELPRV
jgi:putative hydroxymethylpyrimidine transport system substrate-binding protein